MLEKLSKLIRILNRECKVGEYTILAREDFVELEEDEIDELIALAKEKGYIHLQYAKMGMYCLKTLPKIKQFEEEELQEYQKYYFQKEVKRQAFLGGALGGGIIAFLSGLLVWIFH